MTCVFRAPIGIALLGIALAATQLLAQTEIRVSPRGPVRSIAGAIRLAARHSRIVIEPGVYREPTIIVDKPVELDGDRSPTLDGENKRQIMVITADSVTVRGLHFKNPGASFVQDLAAIRVQNAVGCVLEDNRIDGAFFGIYLAKVNDCSIRRNVLTATRKREMMAGNGIHLWASNGNLIEGNVVRGHRDGIYFEFVHNSVIRDNLSENNLRYGLHFMYSDDCRYLGNVFRHNGSGVAVMFTHRVEMTGNRFEGNWGGAAYGLLLKEISDSRLTGNVFFRNTIGLFADGADRLVAERNDFIENGWGVQLESSTQDARFTGNNFARNTFDVASNGSEPTSTFSSNYWDHYRGYDLNRDGYGDVPFRPIRLFSMVVSQNKPAIILLRSTFARLLDSAEQILPVLTPASVKDRSPLMRPRS